MEFTIEKLARYDGLRLEMLRVIEKEANDAYSYTGKRSFDKRVMDAMAAVARHKFIPKHMRIFSYNDGPVSIGHGQTISQPYLVALMTDLIKPQPEHKVLDIGTGSGYQAAILSKLVKQVYSVEVVSPLAVEAISRLQKLGYQNIEVKIDDGHAGWLDKAPFDGIIVAAATPIIPFALIQQLAPGGTLVLPLGDPHRYQELIALTKSMEGEISTRHFLPVSFVPLVGDDG